MPSHDSGSDDPSQGALLPTRAETTRNTYRPSSTIWGAGERVREDTRECAIYSCIPYTYIDGDARTKERTEMESKAEARMRAREVSLGDAKERLHAIHRALDAGRLVP